MLVHAMPYPAGSGGSVTAQSFTVTIPSGKVGSDLTNFPVMVRLSSMPSGFWSNVRSDGGDIRVTTTGGTTIPHDLVRFDYIGQDGVLFFKASSLLAASSNSWKITCGNPALSKLAVTDSNGRNAVWSDYVRVLMFGETADDRTGNGTISNIVNNGDPDQFAVVETSPSLGGSEAIQDICFDGTYYYITYTSVGTGTRIEKRNSSWTVIAQNLDPVGDTGDASINHVGGIDYHNGFLYVALQFYNGVSESAERIGIWRASDLSFVQIFNVSTQHPGCAGITYCTKDDLLYVCSFYDQTKLWKFSPADGSYVGALTLTYPGSLSTTSYQGLTWWRDAFWLNSDGFDETFRVDYAGNVATSGLFGHDVSSGGGEYEGIGAAGDCLVTVESVISGTTTYQAKRWKPVDLAKGAGGGITPHASGDNVKASGITGVTTFTVGVTVAWSATTGANRTPFSYWNSAVDNSRVSLAFRSSSNNIAVWDINNSWLEASPAINPTLNQSYRLHAVYSGTTSRKLFVDGVQKNSQSTITTAPSSMNTLNLLREDDSATEAFSGTLGFAYLRASALSADWLAAEHSNLNAPGSFYTIT